MEKILVPVDFSEGSVAALNFAVTIAKQCESKLLVLHVIHDPAESPGFYAAKKAGKKVFRNMEESARQMMEDFTKNHLQKFGNYDTFILPGIPATQIINFAKKETIDFIAMGTHGRGGFNRLMLGSVADKVIRGATCPVLVVREPRKPKPKKSKKKDKRDDE